ncbi:MFS general substrate transporter [Trametopsis cervina]|nr:MFS general substrate transporter [Trametopsis cervina]
MLPPPTSNSPALSPAQTLVDGRVQQRYGAVKRYVLLFIFCLAQFLDAMNNSALFSAIPSLVVDLGMTSNESTWIISAFQLTFASFLLISGRISDVYNPKIAFICGVMGLGCLSIGGGFVREKIVLIVIRALSGVAASLTIPSALSLLVDVFPEKNEQARAIGVFGGCGAVGNVLGLIIGAIFVEFANWSWVFWFVALVAIPIGFLCMFLVPDPVKTTAVAEPGKAKWKSLDMVGVSILTAALILFIFAVTSGGSATGWKSATVIVPLIISVGMIAGFFYYETCIPAETAAVPPRTWFLPNFASLFGVSLMPFLWWTAIFTILTPLWQEVFHWSAISVALRMIPIGVFSFAISFSGPISHLISPKYVLLFAQALLIVATVLLALADAPSKYFTHVLPAFILGTSGAMLSYTHTNIALFRATPSRMAGTTGAIFNGALQLGSAVGIAAVSSIETSVEARLPGRVEGAIVTSYKGRAAAFWFLLGVVCLEALNLLVFYRVEAEHRHKGADVEQAQAGEKGDVDGDIGAVRELEMDEKNGGGEEEDREVKDEKTGAAAVVACLRKDEGRYEREEVV